MRNFTHAQMEFIKDNHEDTVQDVINQRVDGELTYYSDIEENLNRFSNIVEALNGRYTLSDLYDDMYNEYYGDNFDDIAEDVYDELDEEQQKEIDALED